MADKPKLAMYWAASCGGCEIAVLNLHEKILDLAAAFDFMFCPCLLDTKKEEIEALPDKSIAVTFFNGAIRTGENEEMAHLLREKSRLLIAFGSCACEGCIPGLSNLSSREAHFTTIYRDNPSIDNPDDIRPQTSAIVPEGTLTLPAFNDRVKTLAQIVPVDYMIPGCPPESHRIWSAVEPFVSGAPLPPAGSVIGAGILTVCAECPREKHEKKIGHLYRTWEITPGEKECLLEQGLVCMGIVTRDGCGAPCPQANMPCTGCYGTPPGIEDQGGKMVAALGSVIAFGETRGAGEETLSARIEESAAALPDPAGTFYKYSLPGSILGGRKA